VGTLISANKMNEFTTSIAYVEARLDAQGFRREHGANNYAEIDSYLPPSSCAVSRTPKF
jgi:hypothetical protein